MISTFHPWNLYLNCNIKEALCFYSVSESNTGYQNHCLTQLVSGSNKFSVDSSGNTTVGGTTTGNTMLKESLTQSVGANNKCSADTLVTQ